MIKHLFDHVKARYRGLAENTARLPALFALSILWMVRRQLDGTSGLLQSSKSSEKSANASRNLIGNVPELAHLTSQSSHNLRAHS